MSMELGADGMEGLPFHRLSWTAASLAMVASPFVAASATRHQYRTDLAPVVSKPPEVVWAYGHIADR